MFKIKEALVFKNKYNLLFVVGLVIEGPKGGIYLMDEFCSEHWIDYRHEKRDINNPSLQDYARKAVTDKKITMCIVELNGKNDFVTPNKYKGKTELRRTTGVEKMWKAEMFDKIELIQ